MDLVLLGGFPIYEERKLTDTTTPDHKTFDLIGVLSGRDYPEVEVPVYFNESVGFELFQIDQRRNKAVGEKELAELDEKYAALVKKAEKEQYTVLLKSIPESVRRDIFNSVNDEFPSKKDMLGREEAHPRADEEFSKRMWQAYIRKVTDPEGAVALTDEASVNALYANAPASVHEAINKGIAELQIGPKAAFEQMAKDANFLSDASPEG